MIHVCIITPKKYPVPAVKGGAVEGLVESLMNVNEEKQRMKLTVVSRWDAAAQKEAERYTCSQMRYVEYGGFLDQIHASRIICFLNRMFLKHRHRVFLEQNYIKKVYKKIAKEEFDIIVIEDGEYGIYSYIKKKMESTKICIHLHGEYEGTHTLAEWFSHFICVSNHVARILTMNGIVNAEKVDVLKNGISPGRFQRRDLTYSICAERRKYGISERDIVFVYWGRIIPEKGVKELLEAFQKVSWDRHDVRLLIVGSASFGIDIATEYEKYVTNLCADLEGNVIFTGYIHNSELWRVFHAANIAVLPTICNDAAPLTVLEAAAAGLPCITTNVGGVAEYASVDSAVILDWSLDFIDNLADAMLRLADDPELRIRMGRCALENAKKYSDVNYYDSYVDLIEKYVMENQHNGNYI